MPEQAGTIEHLIPPGAEAGPVDVSIVVPSLNEEITVGEFVDWCRQGLERAGVRGQVLIVDSSADKTPEINTIRALLKTAGIPVAEIAARFGIARSTLYRAVLNPAA